MSPVRTAMAPDCFEPEDFPSKRDGILSDRCGLTDQLQRRLLALDYAAFARCVCLLLADLGYENVRLAGRREWKGFNRPGGGGYDLEGVLPGNLAPRRMIAQIKHFHGRLVPQRSVDELRGACLRTGAAEALLVTTSSFSRVARTSLAPISATAVSPDVAPIRLIDGKELLGLLVRHRLGVRKRSQTRHLEIDEAFFQGIASCGDNEARRNARTGNTLMTGNNIGTGSTAIFGTISAPAAPVPQETIHSPRWRVTIRISTASGQGTRSSDQEEVNLPGVGSAEGDC